MRIGQLGCGRWGKNILRDLLSLGCRVAVADPSPQARALALRMGADSAVEDSSLIGEACCDGYIVATPVRTLAGESEKMLRRGKPVFCEKPVFLTEGERDRLLAAGAAQRLFVMYKFCYHPGFDELRSIIASEELGRVEAISLQRQNWDDNLQETDCLWFAGVHQISIVHHLLGAVPEPESATVSLHGGIVTGASVTLGKAPPVMISLSSRNPQKSISAAVSCERGTAVLPDVYGESILVGKDGCENERRSIGTEMPLLLELKDFLEYLQGGARPRCGFELAESVSMTIRKIHALARRV